MPVKSFLLFFLTIHPVFCQSDESGPSSADNQADNLKTLISKRKDVVLFYQECTKQFNEEKKKQQMNIIGSECGVLQEDMKKMATQDTKDKDILTKLFAEVCNDGGSEQKDNSTKNMTVEDVFEKYGKLINFLEKELKSKGPSDDLSTQFWTRMKQFFTDPFLFLGGSTSVIDRMVGREDTTPPKNGEEKKASLKRRLKENRRLIVQQHICAANLDEEKQKAQIQFINRSISGFKTELDKATDSESMVYINHIKRDFWDRQGKSELTDADSAFREYEYLYNFFDNHIQYYVKNDTDLKAKYWEAVLKFLDEPLDFGGSTVPNRSEQNDSPVPSNNSLPISPTASTPEDSKEESPEPERSEAGSTVPNRSEQNDSPVPSNNSLPISTTPSPTASTPEDSKEESPEPERSEAGYLLTYDTYDENDEVDSLNTTVDLSTLDIRL